MKFITNGPDIPNVLLREHEEGNVVFFCGAGISYPAGLPSFSGLVDKIYDSAGTIRLEIEEAAYKRNQYDTCLDLLERRLPGRCVELRKNLLSVLTPKLELKGAIDTHKALLELSKNRENTIRLVTTNFDRIFEHLKNQNSYTFNTYAAPMLPIPKRSRWSGLVYLHGLLPENENEEELNKLVMTSGDFGLAYLVERWAARFVTELFKTYTICFVGYSLNDPILRYMMDAMAAETAKGENTKKTYAFTEFKTKKEEKTVAEWKAKGVEPILYKVRGKDHSLLHKSLKRWSEIYRDGISGKEQIVLKYASIAPAKHTQQDDSIEQLLWALNDKSGKPAKQFAEMNPVPSLDWLKVFSEGIYKHKDLKSFGVADHPGTDPNFKFNFLNRPAPHPKNPWMSLLYGSIAETQWDAVMWELSKWLLRHINDPELVYIISERGLQINAALKDRIGDRIEEVKRFQNTGKTEKLRELSEGSPNAVPSPLMMKVWDILLNSNLKSNIATSNIYSWESKLKNFGLTYGLKMELRRLLSPRIAISRPFMMFEEQKVDEQKSSINLSSFEVEITDESISYWLKDRAEKEGWRNALPCLLGEFQQALLDALDLLRAVEKADNFKDHSFWDLPSIIPHQQNRDGRSWAILIELLRDAWLEKLKSSPEEAKEIAIQWFKFSYPSFKRLAFFAASQEGVVESDIWVNWLLSDNAYWLWSVNAEREVLRLLVLQGKSLSEDSKEKLECALLTSPTKEDLRINWVDGLGELIERKRLLRLGKLQYGGGILGAEALERFEILQEKYPDSIVTESERDEFSHWISFSTDDDYEAPYSIVKAPSKRNELLEWLKKYSDGQKGLGDDGWRECCQRHIYNCFFALCDLARDGIYPQERWSSALSEWGNKKLLKHSWKLISTVDFKSMPKNFLVSIAHDLSFWMLRVAEKLEPDMDRYIYICNMILSHNYGEESAQYDAELRVLNHPVGLIVFGLTKAYSHSKPGDNDGLPANIKDIFTRICNTAEKTFLTGRMALATDLIYFFRIDAEWAREYLIPLLSWANEIEAKAVWRGFLRNGGVYGPLFEEIKEVFLDTVNHYGELGERAEQYAVLCTFMALEYEGLGKYSMIDFQKLFSKMPSEGLNEASSYLLKYLESSDKQRESNWDNRISPFLRKIWPKDRSKITEEISTQFSLLIIKSGNRFPVAFSLLQNWLGPVKWIHRILSSLNQSDIPQHFSKDCVEFLSMIIESRPMDYRKFKEILDKVLAAEPTMKENQKYKTLKGYL